MVKNNDTMTGAVLVQGGGIAGVQASLDLAESGFKVYLVERSPAIGGMMSHLDKTFPTGDCATCIVSPKLVECARNLNIEILTLSDLVGLEGDPGHFKARVRKYPRYVDESTCTGCGDCIQACPVDILNRFDRNLGTRKAIAKHYAQAVPNIVNILKEGHAPCKMNCPANINVQGYIQLIKKKEYIKAVNLIRERNPLSAICGRVCTHPCESACTRNDLDSPVAIRLLKRFASDREKELIDAGGYVLPEEKQPSPTAKKIGIIGAGPAGLTAAYDLAGNGFAVTVYEAMPEAGGMLRWGIPEYRMPKKVLDHEIELIRRRGVSFAFNSELGKDITLEQLREDYDAVFVGIGAQKSRRLGIEGEDLIGIEYGVEFLRQAAGGGKTDVRGNVVVIGGGNVAVDTTRTALRLGADHVEMVSLEQHCEMPAYPEEIKATLDEGISIRNGWGPKSFSGDNNVNSITLKRCTRVFDSGGRFDPQFDENVTYTIKADLVIVAIGQSVDKDTLDKLDAVTEYGCLKADPVTLETSIRGVFAGGDAVSGPASVIDAVAAGKRAAESILRYLKDEDLHSERFESTLRPIPEDFLPSLKGVEKMPRATTIELNSEQRLSNFEEVELGLSEEAALAECERCLNCALCSECGECVLACEQHSIHHFMREEVIDLDVGSVILTPGFEEFVAEAKGEYGFGRYPNVLSSVQFERMLSASGPYEGHVKRRSDGRDARRIAFIQCVGSRDSGCGNDYCSSICCMATTKQAMVAGEHQPELETTIFYMDIRAHGKDFDQYYERAKNTDGIQYIKSMPSRITQLPGTKDLRLRFVDEQGHLAEKDYDLVVLAVGLEPGKSVMESARHLGIELNDYGFCATDRRNPLITSRPGVFVSGAFQEPKDIPETVTQASAAASMSMELLAGARNTMITKKEYPEEHDCTDEKPRIGVFVCHCGMNIASVIDVEHVTEVIAQQPDVVFATHTMYTCSDSSLSDIRDAIHEHRLNRIVVASCTPRTHEALFRDTLREAGLNPYMFELANVRDQCSWVHSSELRSATEKAIDLACMSIARARRLDPLKGGTLAVDQSACVIGGGLSGMTAALALANQGFTVNLIERKGELGGNLRNVFYTLEHQNIQEYTRDLVQRVGNHPLIMLHLDTEVTSVAGHIGKFHISLSCTGGKYDITSGTIIIATGAKPAETSDYMYGKSGNILTQVQLETQLHEDTFPQDGCNVVMIQCVGSRNDKHSYCSRICCSMAVKNALKIKEKNPDANVFVLYRDIRTYGFRELYYKKAREAGVVFIRYDQVNPPSVTDTDGLVVTVESPDFPETIEIESDFVVLSTGVEAPEGNKKLSDMLKVPLNDDGFYVEAHMKLRPVDFTTEGIFLCGLAHSPKFIDENIAQARAAAARATTVISKAVLDVSAQISHVDQSKCISCMTCVKACPYTAPYVNNDRKAQIEGAKCMGCGICVSECPAHAIQLGHFKTGQFEVMIEELFAGKI
ncbi:MAG: FAD-dependent oxidoreductase [Candidatus Latescibacteria bacterium]|nr:FAD-dependent oxidoreductase [Candidatus Latescibacterota bacterium]